MSWTNLTGANLTDADMSSDMRGIAPGWTDATNTELTALLEDRDDLELPCTILMQSNLTGADLTRANLDGAYLRGAVMPDGMIHD